MRTLLLTFALLLLALLSVAQENFYVENGDIMWRKVFDTKPNASQLAAQLSDVVELDNTINGKLLDVQANYKAAGYKRMQVSMFMANPYEANVQIELKGDRYRVTVRKIQFVDLESTHYLNATKRYTSVSVWLVDGGGNLKYTKTAQRNFDILDTDFTQRFTLANKSLDVW